MPYFVVLEAVYDNSDLMSDYFDRDHTLAKWGIGGEVSKPITEQKLRAFVSKLPAWLQAYDWTFRKGEKYSMSDDPYAQLRVEVADEGIEWRHCYQGRGDSGRSLLGLIIQPDYSEPNGELIPSTLEGFKQLVEEKNLEYERKAAEHAAYLKSPEYKRKHLESEIRQAENITAIFDANGFHQVTEEERAAKIAGLKAELAALGGIEA